MRKDEAYVISIGGSYRYFVGFGARGRLKSAWSIAGACMYLPYDPEIAKVRARLAKKGYATELRVIRIVGGVVER